MKFYLRLQKDLQDKADDCLIDPMGECTQSMLNLIIFGVATPYLHNGTLILGEVEEGKGVSICFLIYATFATVRLRKMSVLFYELIL